MLSTRDDKGSTYLYCKTRINFETDYPFKSILFSEITEEKKLIVRIESWNILEALQFKKMLNDLFSHDVMNNAFFSFQACSIDNVGITFNLCRGGSQQLIHDKMNKLLDTLSHLVTRNGEVLRCGVRFRKAREIIHACINQYCQHFAAGFPLPCPNTHIQYGPTRITEKEVEDARVWVDEQQVELYKDIEAGKPIIERLRQGVNLHVHPLIEPFFLMFALPFALPPEREAQQEQDFDVQLQNIQALLEYGAPVFAPGDSLYQYRSVIAYYTYLAYEVWHSEAGYKQSLESLPRMRFFYETRDESAEIKNLRDRCVQDSEEAIQEFVRESSQSIYHHIKELEETIQHYQRWLAFHKKILQLLMFLDNGETYFYPIPAFLMETSEIFNWIGQGQKAIRLAKQLPAAQFRLSSQPDCPTITYKLGANIYVTTPSVHRLMTNKGKIFAVVTLPMALALNNPVLIQELQNFYQRQFNLQTHDVKLLAYFHKILVSNRRRAYLDIVYDMNRQIHAFNIGKFIHTVKDAKPVLIYHAILAAADNEVTQFSGLMAWLIYFRGFLPELNNISLEVLTVMESASLASYLQLIKMGIEFYPQYNILMDWIPIILKEIYVKEELYKDEEKVITPQGYFRISDPLANFKQQAITPWQTRQTTLTATRLVTTLAPTKESITKYDVIVFFKNDKRNCETFRQYTQSAANKL